MDQNEYGHTHVSDVTQIVNQYELHHLPIPDHYDRLLSVHLMRIQLNVYVDL